MEALNFSNENYKKTAFSSKLVVDNIHSPVDAFLILINGINYGDLFNLCEVMKQNSNLFINGENMLTNEQCYDMTQNIEASFETKENIMNLAEQYIKNGNDLGQNTINGGEINTSSWLSHCFYVSDVCATLAHALGLDSDKARTLGLLHDYGRKFDHSLKHVINGFESLIDVGWDTEAIGCLTHSFLNGGRCSNNEAAVDGFYVDENGIAKWSSGAEKDDVTLFLEKYKFTDYDLILNIADLMATNKGVVSPYDRIRDIATRRVIDPINRKYFLTDLTNLFISFLRRTNYVDNDIPLIKADAKTSLEEIENKFYIMSDLFFDSYSKIKFEGKKETSK